MSAVLNLKASKRIFTELSYEVSGMKVVPYTEDISKYLAQDSVIDYEQEAIKKLSDTLSEQADNELAYIKAAFEFVRDEIAHSADAGKERITCAASEVLKAGHGVCFAKSHLLAAILRCKGIPVGFCYQKLILDDDTAPVLIYHGLVGVYIKEHDKWIRLDARGNKEGVDAQFSIDEERLAFSIRQDKGEVDDYTVYPNPDEKVLERLQKYETRPQLWEDLPNELAYHTDKK